MTNLNKSSEATHIDDFKQNSILLSHIYMNIDIYFLKKVVSKR